MRPRLYTPGQRAATKVAYAIPRSRRLLSPPPSSYGIGAGGQNKLAHRCLLRSQRRRLESVQLGSSSPGGAQAADLYRQEERWPSSTRSLSLRRRRGSLATAPPPRPDTAATTAFGMKFEGNAQASHGDGQQHQAEVSPILLPVPFPCGSPLHGYQLPVGPTMACCRRRGMLKKMTPMTCCWRTTSWTSSFKLDTASPRNGYLQHQSVVWGSGHDGLPDNEGTVLRRSQ